MSRGGALMPAGVIRWRGHLLVDSGKGGIIHKFSKDPDIGTFVNTLGITSSLELTQEINDWKRVSPV